MLFKKPKKAELPGFGLTFGLSIAYMSLLVLIPIAALILYSLKLSPSEYWKVVTNERTLAAFKVSFSSTLIAALINLVFGSILAWALSRYNFFAKKLLDALIDLPFAIPTAVAGISLSYIFSPNGAVGSFLEKFGVQIAYSKTGIVIALIFIGLPFIVRTLEPVITELDRETEDAAASLGANFFQTFTRVTFPAIFPALLTGFAMAFARGLGEYGSIIFISSNMPYESEIVPLLIVKKLLGFDYRGAAAIGVSMLICAFALLLLINLLQSFARRRRA